MRNILHVGFHKTGSTHLQTEVFPKLPGVHLLTRPHTEIFALFNRLKYDLDAEFPEKELRLLIDSLVSRSPNAEVLLISDETLLGAPYKNYLNRDIIAARLSKLFPDGEVIIFLRGQLDLIDSMYNQYVKVGALHCEFGEDFIALNGNGISLEETDLFESDLQMKKSHFFHPLIGWMDVSRFKYNSLLRFYNSVFTKVHVFLYEDLLSRPGMVYDRLGRILNCSIPYQPTPGREVRVNTRLSDERMWRKLIDNRVESALPGTKRKIKKIISFAYYMYAKDGFASRKTNYIGKIRNDAGFSEDNILANKTYDLGMENYSDKYFF